MDIKTLFKDLLDENSKELISKIESDLGNIEVSYGEPSVLNAVMSASTEKGKPIITIKPDHRPTKEDLNHELWHLLIRSKLNCDGFAIDSNSELGGHIIDTSNGKSCAQNLISELSNILEHHYFYPIMAEQGLEPSKLFVDSIGGWGYVN